MVVVTLGAFTWNRLIDFDETKSRKVPRKTARGALGSIEEEVAVTMPRQITLVGRVSTSELTTLDGLQDDYEWKVLSDGGDSIDSVWIEEIEALFRQTECVDSPWLVTITMLCSNV